MNPSAKNGTPRNKSRSADSQWPPSVRLSSVLIVGIFCRHLKAAQKTSCSVNAAVLRTKVSESRPRFKTDPSLTVMLDSTSSTTVTKSKPSDFPSFLRQKLSSVQTVRRHEVNTEAMTNQTCPKCGRLEVRFSAVQLRSADEGSTIFFTCECGYKYVVLLRGHHVMLLINQQMGRKQLDISLPIYCFPSI